MPKRNGEAAGRLGRILAAARAGRGVTLREMEGATGLSNAYLSQLETGKARNPSTGVLSRLSAGYGVAVGTLMGAVGQCPGPPDPAAAEFARWLRAEAKFLRRRADEMEAYAADLEPPGKEADRAE